MEKYDGIYSCLGSSDSVGIAVKLEEIWFGLVLSPTFMLGLWHEADWIKEIFGSANLRLGGSWKSHT